MANLNKLNTARLAAALRAKRGKTGLRATAEEIGNVSAATLSRIEQGRIPDVETFLRLCQWLKCDAGEFVDGAESTKEAGLSTPAILAAHLRADRTLSPDTAQTLIDMIELAYRKDWRK